MKSPAGSSDAAPLAKVQLDLVLVGLDRADQPRRRTSARRPGSTPCAAWPLRRRARPSRSGTAPGRPSRAARHQSCRDPRPQAPVRRQASGPKSESTFGRSTNRDTVPASASSFAAASAPPQATRARVPPTLIRRASGHLGDGDERGVDQQVHRLGCHRGDDGRDVLGRVGPRCVRQSAPASSYAFSQRMVSSMSGRRRREPSDRPVGGTLVPDSSIA